MGWKRVFGIPDRAPRSRLRYEHLDYCPVQFISLCTHGDSRGSNHDGTLLTVALSLGVEVATTLVMSMLRYESAQKQGSKTWLSIRKALPTQGSSTSRETRDHVRNGIREGAT